MVITLAAFLIRAIRPCFTQAAFLKTKYWSHYIDTERKLFDETCKEHAKSFAKVCIQQYFESISGEIVPQFQLPTKKGKGNEDGEKQKSDEEKLHGIRKEADMNKVLWNWHTCKPALFVNKHAEDMNMNGHVHLDTLRLSDERYTHTPMKNTAVVYYSKVWLHGVILVWYSSTHCHDLISIYCMPFLFDILPRLSSHSIQQLL